MSDVALRYENLGRSPGIDGPTSHGSFHSPTEGDAQWRDSDPIARQVDRLRRRFQLSDPLAKALAPIIFGEAPR